MKDNGAEELIRGKIDAEEAAGGLLDNNDALWSALSQRLGEKKNVPKPRLYIYWAAASVLLLIMAGLWLYPARRAGHEQQAIRVQPAATGQECLPEEQKVQQPTVQAMHNAGQETIVQADKQAPPRKRQVREPEKEVQNEGRYAMPQIACAELPAGNYPLCSQTL